MSDGELDRKYLDSVIAVTPLIEGVVDFVNEHPELAHQETETSAYLVTQLRSAGFRVEEGIAGMPTAFRAELRFAKPGKTVGVIAVYDAPASINAEGNVEPVHSCGHGPQAGGVIGAALALARVRAELSGTVVIIGCPADEIHSVRTRQLGSGKALTADRGAWDDIDVALYPHPEFIDTVWPSSLWMRRETARIVGERSLRRDVVSTPLVAMASVTKIAELFDPSQLIIESVTVDGDVEQGAGMTFEASFLAFAATEAALEKLVAEVRSQLSGARWTSSAPIAEVRADAGVTALVAKAFTAAGRDFVANPPALGFATDFGNVTQVVPAALVGVGRAQGWRYHTPQGAEEFLGLPGKEVAIATAEVIGLSVIKIGAASNL